MIYDTRLAYCDGLHFLEICVITEFHTSRTGAAWEKSYESGLMNATAPKKLLLLMFI